MNRLLVRALIVLLVAGVCAAAQQPRRIRVSADVLEKRLVKSVPPEYPPLAKKARIEGFVRLHAIIGYEGNVEQLEVVSGHPLLIQSSLDAVRQWQYQPMLLNGEPIQVESTIDVVFAVTDEPKEEDPPPTPAEQLEARTEKLMREGRYEQAVAEVRAAIAENQEDIASRLFLARLLITMGRDDEAINELREALRIKPDNLEMRYMLFAGLLEADRVHEAISEFHEMRRLGEPPARALAQVGAALYRTMRPEAAEAEFKLLVQGHSEPAAVLAALAQELALAGRLDAALRLMAEAEHLSPENGQFAGERAQAEQFRALLGRGMSMLRARLQQNPNQPAARMLLAMGFMLQDEWESKGRDELLAAFELGFDESEGNRLLSEVLQRRLGRTAFVAELRGWVRRFPRLPNLHLLLAETIWSSGDRAGGIAELRNAIAAAPQNVALRKKLAQYLSQMGDDSGAAAELETVRSLAATEGEGGQSSLRALAEEIIKTLVGEETHKPSEAANETSAIGSVRIIVTANVMYSSTYGSGFAPALANLGPVPDGTQPSAQLADLIDATLASGTKSGYTFTYVVTSTDEKGQPATFEIYADPIQPGTTGNRWFYADHSGVIRVSTGGRAGPASPPLQ